MMINAEHLRMPVNLFDQVSETVRSHDSHRTEKQFVEDIFVMKRSPG